MKVRNRRWMKNREYVVFRQQNRVPRKIKKKLNKLKLKT